MIDTPLKIDSWRDGAALARRIYHRALVPVLCVALVVLVVAKIFPGLYAIVLSQLSAG